MECSCNCDKVEIPRGFPFTLSLPSISGGNFRAVLTKYRDKKTGIEGHAYAGPDGSLSVLWDEQQTLELEPKKIYNLEIWNSDNGSLHMEKIRFARAVETYVGANGKTYDNE